MYEKNENRKENKSRIENKQKRNPGKMNIGNSKGQYETNGDVLCFRLIRSLLLNFAYTIAIPQ